jgi:putative ABC transport system permease protein
MISFAYNLRSLIVRWGATLAATLGLAAVVFLFSAVMMFSAGLRRTLGRSASPGTVIILAEGAESETTSAIDDTAAGMVLADGHIARDKSGQPRAVAEIVVTQTLQQVGSTKLSNIQLRGVPGAGRGLRDGLTIVAGRPPRPGTDEVMVGEAIRGRYAGLGIGDSLELPRGRVVVVGSFVDEGSVHESEVWGDIETFRSAFGLTGLVSAVRAELSSPGSFDAFKAAVDEQKQFRLNVQRESEYYDRLSGGINSLIRLIALIVALFFSFSATIGATITMYASVAHRQREVGTLRALGFSRRQVLTSFLIESTTIALTGGILGMIAAIGLKFVKVSLMNAATGTEIVFAFRPTPAILVLALGVATLMGIIGGFFPAVRAASMDPIEAIRR